MSQPERPLGEHLSPRVDEARLARQWGEISARVQAGAPPRWRTRRVLAIAAMTAALGAVVLVAVRVGRHEPETPQAARTEREVLTLPDGSRITLDPGSRMALTRVEPERVNAVLESGAIDLDIPPARARTFVVSAAGYEIAVLGTAFRVQVEQAMLRVDVARGRVQVTRADGSEPRVLGAGEHWSAREAAPMLLAPVAAPSESVTATPAAPPPRAGTAIAPVAPVALAPKELLARATEARAAGRSHDAAAALDQLRKRYRSDPRAGLAAFELGRLRLEALGDAAGAVEAFDDALALAPSGSFREDAEARRVDALATLGDPRCAAARAAYLERYPRGVHARTVSQRCNTR